MSKNRVGAVLCGLVLLMAMLPITAFAQSIDGHWIKKRKNVRLTGRALVIDLKKKQVRFSYRGLGRVVLKITSIKKDQKVDMPRYTLRTRSRWGKIVLTVLAFGPKKIYVGHSYLKRLKIWGTYTKK